MFAPRHTYNPRCRKLYPIHTKLGRLIHAQGLMPIDVCREITVHNRQMTEYLAGRIRPSKRVITRMVEFFGVPEEDIYEVKYPWLDEDMDDEVLVAKFAAVGVDIPPDRPDPALSTTPRALPRNVLTKLRLPTPTR